jgi:lysophospholipase L1-like esterase
MKRVLCYGDSNTFGLAPLPAPMDWRRYDGNVRWPGVLRAVLGDGCEVIEEGLPGRTTVLDDPIDGAHLNGLTYLTPCLFSHWPLDAVVVMLGTNDLKKRFSIPAVDIGAGAGVLLNTIKRATPDWTSPAKLLLVAPAPIECVGWLADVFEGGEGPSRLLGKYYAAQAAAFGAGFLDAGTVVRVSPIDGIHLDERAQDALGRSIASAVRSLLS